MIISELIWWLEKMKQEHGDINVCVYNYCHEMPCESIVPEYRDNDFYINFCEDDVEEGEFVYLG